MRSEAQSDASRSHQWSSVVISGHQLSSVAISSHQWSYLLETELAGGLGHIALPTERVVLHCDEGHLMRGPRLDGRHEL